MMRGTHGVRGAASSAATAPAPIGIGSSQQNGTN
jgi:hypothetical protein